MVLKLWENMIVNMNEEKYITVTQLPIYKCRWWLKMRACKRAQLIGKPQSGVLPVQEFYVPWWAWPLEILHRILFGKKKINAN